MTPSEEFEALDRIFKLIKTYQPEMKGYLDSANNDFVTRYLVKHLSAEDMQLWFRLEAREVLSTSSLNDWLTNRLFKQLLGQYKRASHELIQSWHQSHCLN